MKIEAGKYYRTRDGQKVGPMRWNGGTDWNGYCAAADCAWGFHESGRFGVMTGKVDGPHRTAYERQRDLIADWTETDLTAITTPFGLLDPATQQALRDHGGPYEIYGDSWSNSPKPLWRPGTTYRVKPKPAMTQQVLYWHNGQGGTRDRCPTDTHAITITIEGDKPTAIKIEALE